MYAGGSSKICSLAFAVVTAMSVYSAIIPSRQPVAKASDENRSDGQGRKLGEQSGLDTRVVLAVNTASKVLHILRGYAVSKRSR